MPKMTIYIPEELQERMDLIPPGAGIEPNWSALAQEVFNRECDRYAERMKLAPKIRGAADRLRRSKENSEDQAKSSGDTAGRRWAAEKAEYVELVRLKQFRKRTDWDKRKSEGVGLVWPVFEAIVGWSDMDGQYDPDWCIDFWSEWTTEATDTFVKAFVDGALALFAEVEPKL